jgi:hypothetical protein
VHSEVWRKILRLILGLSISMGVAYFFFFITKNSNDQATKFFFIFFLPNALVSFFVFGLFPIICNRIGLVISSEQFQKMKKLQEQRALDN